MGNSLRCCLACVIPCGALDVIRIVHLNGQVEELTRSISAGEVLKANPNYVLSKPSSSQGMVRRILILSPDSELKRGNIYFLIPASSVPERKKINDTNNISVEVKDNNKIKASNCNKKIESCQNTDTNTNTRIGIDTKKIVNIVSNTMTNKEELVQMDCVKENIPPEKKSTRHRRRASRASKDWKPHLESISEDTKHFSGLGIRHIP